MYNIGRSGESLVGLFEHLIYGSHLSGAISIDARRLDGAAVGGETRAVAFQHFLAFERSGVLDP